MGCVASRDARQPRVVLILGLDGAGATTILYQLALGKRLDTIPTLGSNVENLTSNGVAMECYDIGGLVDVRPLWSQYARSADGVIFVVDASDDDARWQSAAKELEKLFKGDDQNKLVRPSVPLLLLANKQDVAKAASYQEVEAALRVPTLPVKYYKTFPCSALDKGTLLDGMKWFTEQLKQQMQG